MLPRAGAPAAPVPPLLDELAATYEAWKYGPSRTVVLLRFCAALVSVSSSLLLVWIVLQSRTRLTTTYHRLVVAMSCADVFMSTGMISFSAAVPRELGYFVWNARGDEATCTAVGFAGVLGASMTLLYSCSVNLFYLAQIRYDLSSSYIARYVEPWLHAFPVAYGLFIGMVGVATNGINVDKFGDCFPGAYTPPHCDGYEDGDIPGGGFEIPCGRGRDVEAIFFVMGLVTLLVPVFISISLWMVYKSVLKKEKLAREHYAGSIENNNATPRTINDDDDAFGAEVGARRGDSRDDNDGGGIFNRIKRACSYKKKLSRISPYSNSEAVSRILLHRAAAYSLSYFVTWVWFVLYIVCILAGKWPTEFPPPRSVVYFNYVWNFLNPLQGLWNLLIYVHPLAVSAKLSADGPISWTGAFARAVALAVVQ